MIYVHVRVKEILKEKKKTKYWLVKRMEGGYQAITRLMENSTVAIRFETLEKLCEILECQPGDILVLKERKK
ncbi:MAG: helix-turn-helix transcriptional regulator [Clostridia bacterium]|nr:helix-turn-helix transcriptional regulator [Clostridia bacterium]